MLAPRSINHLFFEFYTKRPLLLAPQDLSTTPRVGIDSADAFWR